MPVSAFTGAKLVGTDDNALGGNWSDYNDTVVTAGAAGLNGHRTYLNAAAIHAGGDHIGPNQITMHADGITLAHSLRTNYDPGGGIWASIPAGGYDAIFDQFITEVYALTYTGGAAQEVITMLDPEMSRYASNSGFGAGGHGTMAQYAAAAQYWATYLRANDPDDRIRILWCDQWFAFKNHPTQVRACFPGNAYIDGIALDLPYNKSLSSHSWYPASKFLDDFYAFENVYLPAPRSKQLFLVELDCEPWGAPDPRYGGGLWPTGVTSLDTSKRPAWITDFLGIVAADDRLCSVLWWNDEWPLNDSTSLNAFGVGGAAIIGTTVGGGGGGTGPGCTVTTDWTWSSAGTWVLELSCDAGAVVDYTAATSDVEWGNGTDGMRVTTAYAATPAGGTAAPLTVSVAGGVEVTDYGPFDSSGTDTSTALGTDPPGYAHTTVVGFTPSGPTPPAGITLPLQWSFGVTVPGGIVSTSTWVGDDDDRFQFPLEWSFLVDLDPADDVEDA